ncbi:MAG: DNA polymerase Y family protein, partial [Candidatus Rokuibacteriota bacterium]
MERVSVGRFACVRVPHFAAAAAERCEPELRELPLAIVAGTPPATRVVEASPAARERAVHPGLTSAEAVVRCPALLQRPVSDEAVASARHALLDACLAVSPRVEDAGAGLVNVDLAGLRRLYGVEGDETAIGERLVRAAHGVGLEARVGIASSRATARVAALLGLLHGSRVSIVPPGGERAALATIPLGALALGEDVAAALARWGITTLGGVADLPRPGLARRLGASGLAAHDLASGVDREPFVPWAPPPYWEEAQGLEWEIDSLGALGTVIGRALERLCARLEAAHLWADRLETRLALATGGHHVRAVALSAPMGDPRLMWTLLVLDLERHPPPSAVVGVALSARVVPRRAQAGDLWRPAVPAVRDLAHVLTRLTALVGDANVGAPVVADSHHPDPVTLAPFAPAVAGAVALSAPMGDPRLMWTLL